MLSLRPRTGETSRIAAFSVGLAGFVYAVLGPVHAVHGWWSHREAPETVT